MSKAPTLSDLSNLSNPSIITTVNANNEKIELSFQNTLSLDGSTPNAMGADLDMNGNNINNVQLLSAQEINLNGVGIASMVGTAIAASAAFDNVSEVLSDTVYTYNDLTVGQILRTAEEGFAYEVAAVGATDHDITTAGGLKLYVLPDASNAKAFGTAGDGTTNDTAALIAAAGSGDTLTLPRQPYKVTSQVAVPASVYIDGRGGSRYANVNSQIGGRILSALTTAGAAIYRDGVFLQSQGAGIRGLAISGHDDIEDTDLSGVAVYGLQFNNVFNEIIENLTVENLNGAAAVWTSGQCNKLVFINPRVLTIGTYSDLRDVAPSHYGTGMYLAAAPDSEVINGYIEGIGSVGLNITSNSKVIGGFIDLCRLGIAASGERPSIKDASLKFHRRQAIGFSSAQEPKVSGCKMVTSNRDKQTWSINSASTITMEGEVSGLIVKDCDFRHLQQWRGPALPPVIHLGPADGSSAEVVGCAFGDVVTGGTHIVDPNALWAAGDFTLRDFTLDMGRARSKLTTAVAFTAGLTVTNEFFTVTQGGATYVANGKGHTFPWVTTSTFNYTSAYDRWEDPRNDWVLLEAPDTNGMFIPANVRTDIGNCRITGDGTQVALTLGRDASVTGVIRVGGCATWMKGASGAVGPKFIGTAAPTTMLTSTSPSSFASLRGWQYPVAVTHTGGGTNETVDLAPLPARASGRVSLSVGFGGGVAFTLSANIQFDGTTLTVTDRACAAGVFDGAATLVASGGFLRLQWSAASAKSGTATVDFDGLWTVAT